MLLSRVSALLPEHLGANFHQVRTDGSGRSDRIAGQQCIGDLAMVVLIFAPADRIGVALLQLEPRALVADSDDRLIDGDGKAVMRRRHEALVKGAIPMLPLFPAIGAIAAVDARLDRLEITLARVQRDRLGE